MSKCAIIYYSTTFFNVISAALSSCRHQGCKHSHIFLWLIAYWHSVFKFNCQWTFSF